MTELSTQDASPDEAAAALGQPLRIITAPALAQGDQGALVVVVEPSGREITGTVLGVEPGVSALIRPLGGPGIEEAPDSLGSDIKVQADPGIAVYVMREAPRPQAPQRIDPDVVRELAEITRQIQQHEGAVKDLKKRKAELSDQLASVFQLHGVRRITVDNQPAYIYSKTYPRMRERPEEEGGGTYGADDLVAAFTAIGRTGDIKPAHVNHQTLGAVLREYRDAERPLPAPLARVVELVEDPEVRVGKATK